MELEQITSLLIGRDNFLYCSFELVQKNKNPQTVVFVELQRYKDYKQKNVWHYVHKKDFQKLTETHDHNLIKSIGGDSIISLCVFDDIRLSRQKL